MTLDEENHCFTQDEIELAEYLLGFQWNANVTDFLYVVARIARPGLDVPDAYGELVYPLKKS